MTERFDDWTNPAAGLGSLRDKATGVGFSQRERLTRSELRALYTQNAIARRIVDKVVDDALRYGFDLEGLQPEQVQVVEKALDRLKFRRQLARWAKWGRLYGGAVLCPITLHNAKATPADPLRLNTVTRVLGFRAVDADHARPMETDAGWASPTFGQTLKYQIQGIVSHPVDVHYSRAFPFEAVDLPTEDEAEHPSPNGWNASALDLVFDDLARAGSTRAHAVSMMYVASITYLKLHGYRETYKTKDGKEELQKMLADIRRDLDARGLLGIDAADDIGSITIALNGVHELIDKAQDALASSTIYPREVLFNESQNGLRGGELSGAQALYHATTEAFQSEQLEPVVLDCLRIVYAAEGIKAEPKIAWRPLWVPSEAEEATQAKTNSETDRTYFEIGALTADEIRSQRFVEGRRGALQLDPEEAPAPIDLSAEVAAAEQAANGPIVFQPAEIPAPADTAMSGSQIAGMLSIVTAAQSGEIPRDAAAGILAAAFPVLRDHVEAVLGSAGLNPTPAAPAAPSPATPEVTDEAGPSADLPPGDIMSPREAAAKFGVPTRTITLQMERGRLRYWGLGAHTRVSEAEVAALARAHEAPPEPAAAEVA